MNIKFKWIGGATWTLQIGNIKIACDPVLCPGGTIQDYKYFNTKRLNDPVYGESDFKDVSHWLLTHNHEDHIDKAGFEKISRESSIISHKGLHVLFRKDQFTNLRFLKWNEVSEFSSEDLTIKIKALPAIHAKRKILSAAVGNGNGYLLDITGSDFKYLIYITGDSVYSKSIIKLIGASKIDLIIANAGAAMAGRSFMSRIIGRITNSISDIKKMDADLNPQLVIPVHHGTFSHYSEKITQQSFDGYDNIKVLDPGESITLPRVFLNSTITQF